MLLESSRSNRSRSPYVIQARVVLALMLRDIRTRFFGHGLGYLIAIAWPLAHIIILIGLWTLMGRTTPYGSSLALYFATGLVPVMSFIYASRWIMLSVVTNRSLMGFPVVRLFDILVARALLEVAASCCMVLALISIFMAAGIDPRPVSSLEALKALGAALLLGIGFGCTNGVIAAVYPLWATAYALFTIIFYIISGILFVPDHMPEAARQALSLNPLLHTVEWMRTAYYGSYTSRTLDKLYVLGWGFGTLCLSLAFMRFGRRFVSG